MTLGATELIIILIIVILLFGVGRVSKVFGELGSGIRAFKDGLKSPEENTEQSNTTNQEIKDDK